LPALEPAPPELACFSKNQTIACKEKIEFYPYGFNNNKKEDKYVQKYCKNVHCNAVFIACN